MIIPKYFPDFFVKLNFQISRKTNKNSGMMYYASHLWWSQMENGIMKNLRMNLNNPALEEEKQIEELGRVVDYFCKNRGRHKLYGKHWLYVTIFNAIHVFLDITALHFILNRYLIHVYVSIKQCTNR